MKESAAILIAISSYWMLDSFVHFASDRSLLEIISSDLSFRVESLLNVAYNAALIGFVYHVYRKLGHLGE